MERETNYIYSPLGNNERQFSRRRCLACFKTVANLPMMFLDYLFSSPTFENRPRNFRAYIGLFQLNMYAAVVTCLGGVCLFEFSAKPLTQAMNRTAIFPLYFPHAIGLALACKYQGSVFLGNFVGYYFTRIYLLVRGPFGMTLNKGLFIIMIALLGDIETSIGAWLMQVYLCRREVVRKKVPTIDNVRQAFCYIVIVLGTTLCFDTLIAIVACGTHIVKWNSFLRFWATWWLGVVAGMLTLSPAIIHMLALHLPRSRVRVPNYYSLFKSLVLWTMLFCVLILVFLFSVQSFVRPLPYLVFPLIIFASFRFNRVGWALVVAVISLFCAWGTIHRNSSLYYMAGAPKDKSSPSLILQIELFVSVMGLVGIVLAAAVKEKIQLTNDLNKVNEELEDTISDRTNELVKANQELRISQQKAEHASHAKSDFLANMSHEIRTPIHGILGLTALLLESELTSDQRDSLLSVKECADLLLHIINSVLDLSKIEAGRLEVETVSFSVRKMVCSTLRMMQARACAHNLQLLWDIEGAVPDTVVGDPGKLQQCLLNLVGNALKFTNEGSVTVRVTLSRQKIQDTPVEVEKPENEETKEQKDTVPPLFARPPKPPSTLSKLRSWASWPGPYFKSESAKSPSCTIDVHDTSDNDTYHGVPSTKVAPVMEMEILSPPPSPETVHIEFEVQDTGIGISKEKLQDMFNPFTQADASTSRLYGGTGLGLCIVQRFVELLGGTIWAESEVNKGSTFGFKVPFQLVSDNNSTWKPELCPGPLRFSSLDAPVMHKHKNGLKRRAYSLDVLMRSMKFTLPSLDEGNDGEESVSSKESGGSVSKGGSLQRTQPVEAMVANSDAETSNDSKDGFTLLAKNQLSTPRSFDSSVSELESSASSLIIHDKEQMGMDLPAVSMSPKERSSNLQESLPPSGPKDRLHKIRKSYPGHSRQTGNEEKQVKPPDLPKPASASQQPISQSSKVSKHSTVINVGDSIEVASAEQVGSRELDEVPLVDTEPTSCPADLPVSMESPLLPEKFELPADLPVSMESPLLPEKFELPADLPVSMESPLLAEKFELPAPSKTSSMRATSKLDRGRGFQKNAAANDKEQTQQTLHILLAEDNPINQKVASRQLQRHGHKVTIVGDGKQALEAVENNHGLYDLVLMDVQMPNMDGLQATEMIRDLEAQRNWFRLPILGLTAHAIQGYQETCLSHGMDGYLGKPFEIKQLLKQMHDLLSTSRVPKEHG